MVRLGGAASPSYVGIFRGLQAHFLRHGIELDWVIYSNYDALVDAFARREIDLAWNAPLAYVKTKRRLQGACQVVAMRDVDVNFTTHFIANADSVIAVVQDLKGKRVALGSRGSMQAGLLPYYFLQQLGLDPAHDLALCSFYDERQGDAGSDERDVVERVGRREYDAGAVSGRTIDRHILCNLVPRGIPIGRDGLSPGLCAAPAGRRSRSLPCLGDSVRIRLRTNR